MESDKQKAVYVERWNQAASEISAKIFMGCTLAYTIGSVPLIAGMGAPDFVAGRLQASNAVCLTMSSAAWLYYWRTRRPLTGWCKATMAVTGLAIAVVMNSVLRHLPDQTASWSYVLTALSLPAIFALIWPDMGRRGFYVIGYFFACAIVAIEPIGFTGHAFAVLTTAVLIVFAAKLTIVKFLKLIATQEMHIERLAKEGERNAIEQEMVVARRIQDSFSDEDSELKSGRHRIAWFQTRHGVVGGDWLTARVLADGRTVAMVVDAAGKGLQAALVVHAVQSLWADAMGQASFSPRDWICRVNAMLIRLGRKAPHAVTLGIVLIDEERLEYWSAGHVPLYCVMRLGGRAQARRIFGHGSMLGITGDYDLQPETLDLGGHEVDVILCSDGLNPGGGILRKRQIENLVAEVNARGFDAMREVPSDDDRSVVWIKAA